MDESPAAGAAGAKMVNPKKLLTELVENGRNALQSSSWHAVLGERELAAVKLAEYYTDQLGAPGLPAHLYLVTISKMSRILDALDPALELEIDG